MPRGKIKRLTDRGFGFIAPDDGGRDVFFLARVIKGGPRYDELCEGMEVEYEAQRGPRGLTATVVRALGGVTPPPRSRSETRPRSPKSAPDTARSTPVADNSYRFLNPFNFVRLLTPKKITEAGILGEKLRNAGLSSKPAELNETVRKLLRRCPPPPHDRYVGITGEITCILTAVTPLFISNSENVVADPTVKNPHKSFEFFKLNGKPAIPASSLRGMVRSVFEAVTNSCIPTLNDVRLSYHLPPQDALRLIPARVEKEKVESKERWFLKLLSGATEINWKGKPKGPQYAAWVRRYKPIRPSSGMRSSKDYAGRKIVPLNGFGHKSRCWARLRQMSHPRRNFTFFNVEELSNRQEGPDWVEGYLCVTNQNIENKHDERFFFCAAGLDQAKRLEIDKDVGEGYKVIKDYLSLIQDYQLRHKEQVRKRRNPGEPEWDQLDIKKSKPAYSPFVVRDDGKGKGLECGDLVYVMLKDENAVEFIVPVSVPRVAYDDSVGDLLPQGDDLLAKNDKLPADCDEASSPFRPCKRIECLCPSCRVFGWVEQPDKESGGEQQMVRRDPTKQIAYAGRVAFSHGALIRDEGTLYPVPLAILSSPKPTTTRFYLKPKNREILETWTGQSADKGYHKDSNELRGRKFYRHHGIADEREYTRANGVGDDQNRTVRDALKPGARFEFKVRFENLASIELGALLWSLEMDGLHHRLGFAKPLGFGSATIQVDNVKVFKPAVHYAFQGDDGWGSVPADDCRRGCVEEFKQALADLYHYESFNALPNIQDLRALLGKRQDDLPIHYPRVERIADPEGKNYQWFMANNRYQFFGFALARADDDKGLPLITYNEQHDQ